MQQYWVEERGPYNFMPAAEMAEAFRNSAMGQAAAEELAQPPQRTKQGEPQAFIETQMAWQNICMLKGYSALEVAPCSPADERPVAVPLHIGLA